MDTIETNGRTQILLDESEGRSVLMQWFSAKKYQDREKQFVKMYTEYLPERDYQISPDSTILVIERNFPAIIKDVESIKVVVKCNNAVSKSILGVV